MEQARLIAAAIFVAAFAGAAGCPTSRQETDQPTVETPSENPLQELSSAEADFRG